LAADSGKGKGRMEQGKGDARKVDGRKGRKEEGKGPITLIQPRAAKKLIWPCSSV